MLNKKRGNTVNKKILLLLLVFYVLYQPVKLHLNLPELYCHDIFLFITFILYVIFKSIYNHLVSPPQIYRTSNDIMVVSDKDCCVQQSNSP